MEFSVFVRTCSPEVAALALQAIESQRAMPVPEHWEEETCRSRRNALDQMERILKDFS